MSSNAIHLRKTELRKPVFAFSIQSPRKKITMQNKELAEQLRIVKQSLRGVMNGPVSASMREKGLAYKINFGVELPRLQEMSEEFPHTYELSAALWKEDIRECKILAGMLMPVEQFDAELAEIWIEQMRFTEEAECTVMHLFSRAPWASTKAFEWIASENPMAELCGYLLFSRLFMQGFVPSKRDSHEYLDQTSAALKSDTLSVKNAAGKALIKFMNLGEEQEQAAEEMLAKQ